MCARGGGDTLGFIGTATGTTATSLTMTGAGWVVNAFTGHLVVAHVASPGAYGVVVSNTATVLTLDRWSAVATPEGAAASTPTTPVFTILPGAAPAFFMALTANSTAPAASDTTLAGEITTAGGGLIRRKAVYAHTTGSATYTLTGSYTVNGSDIIPVTIAKGGIFTSITAGIMEFETLLNATATLSAVGDPLTVTWTVNA
ncbi:MAG: hypothetical protein ACRDTZ_00315 [Pseudonocardiaceae bacterium]